MKNPHVGCSAEGHVSHILSARLSSRPMAWSQQGAEKMAEALAKINEGSYVEPSKITTGKYLEDWLSTIKNSVKPTTWEGKLPNRSIKYIHVVLRNALQQAIKEQLLRFNPATAVKLPKQK